MMVKRPIRAGAQSPSLTQIRAEGLDASTSVLTGAPGTIVGPVTGIDLGTIFVPRPLDFVGNLFEQNRPGDAVVRPDDLVALRIETRNLTIVAGTPPRLKKQASGAANIILHFPPQSITEETFFETRPSGTQNPAAQRPDEQVKQDPAGGSETPRTPPIRARIAGESRLVFQVPDGFDVPYTLEGVLDACQALSLKVAANAGPRGAGRRAFTTTDLFDSRRLAALPAAKRAALASFAIRSTQIAAVQSDFATLRARQFSGGTALKALPRDRFDLDVVVPSRPGAPRPVLPSALTTSIELPWRLILSPHAAEKWRHATAPATSPATSRTELWHSRLVAPDADGKTIEPPYDDPNRTVRAIWALSGEGSTKSMQSGWPVPVAAALPAPSTAPFRMPLDDYDRFQIAHLSSNFSVSNYTPQPVDTNLMMLTALGGWLESRGNWDPSGLSVEEWGHRASMGRDHYVRVVYRGFLFPFGHRVSLVKVSERKFHNGAKDGEGKPVIEQMPGNAAYLRQRLFLIVRERERNYVEPGADQLRNNAGNVFYSRQFPFTSIRVLTQVTPNLDQPTASDVAGFGQLMFWPNVNGQPFKFQFVATDLDGRRVAFDLPMIFMDNTLACPRILNPGSTKLVPDFAAAETNAAIANQDYANAGAKHTATLNLQRVAMATSVKAGDTSVQVEEIDFGGEVEANNQTLRNFSNGLNRPVFFPKVSETRARIGALAHLSGSTKSNALVWNAFYLKKGFDTNVGEIFADVKNDPNMAKLDFSSQGDRSGGFVQPNLKPNALSRFAGPVMGDVGQFIDGKVPAGGGFPTSISDLPLPLLFGCIPLGEVIEAVANLVDSPEKIPKFGSEASTQVESFINGLVRLYAFIEGIASQPSSIGNAAMSAFKASLNDLLAQAKAYAAAQIAPVEAAANQLMTALNDVAVKLQALASLVVNGAATAPDLTNIPASIATARSHLADLKTAANANIGGVNLPSGIRQSLLGFVAQLDAVLEDLQTLPVLVAQGKALFDALDAIVGDPSQIEALFSDPATLKTRVEAVAAAIGPLKTTVGGFDLLDGAPRKVIVDAMTAVEEVLGGIADLLKLIEGLVGEELTIRFDWNPEIDSWWLPGTAHTPDKALFRANDKHGFLIAVEAKVKKNGASAPKISVSCGLKHFDLVLIAPASFLELNFEKIEFSIDSAAKMDVDVLLNDIKFVGPLSFVETLRDLIPLDGFSDPPYLDISTKGIDAGFSVTLPSISIGVMSLSNLGLGAGFTVPFIGQPLSVRFNFCTREQPFCLTVYMFGGGGFFGVTIDPHGVQILEASFEFGASISIDLGVASGGVHVMAGIYFRMEQDAASLTGYFRLGGHVSVLGIITASLELYLELRYEFQSGKCVGKAQLTIEISVFIFSGSVTITCERKFSGANGDPSLREMLGFNPTVPLDQELGQIDADTEYAWRDHCEAFA
ncbi:hypothetical protein [Rhizobium sp. WYJ-E13]|uniref:hypothetical protein n=1 Tax=Rhizobium sp. WYJ-E13 TaxID=2849093 RepID=UPI0020A732B7|nr:hypothetical protein [Rhizobium sp. WYJ-E13]